VPWPSGRKVFLMRIGMPADTTRSIVNGCKTSEPK